MKLSFFILLFLFIYQSYAQDIDYAKNMITTLCSEELGGRGYLKKQDQKAADLIQKELQSFGVKSFNDSYLQEFYISVNTFPKDVVLEVDGVSLSAGVDFIPTPYSGSGKGEYPVDWLNKDVLKDTNSLKLFLHKERKDGFVLIVDTAGAGKTEITRLMEALVFGNRLNAKAIVVVEGEKLVNYMSQFDSDVPRFMVRKGVIQSDCKSIKYKVRNKFKIRHKTQNVVGYIEGKKDTFIVFSAHYDHLGSVGEQFYFPGAHDNASGVSMVLDIMKHYHETGEKPEYSITCMFFSAEEVGILGSKYYVMNPLFPLEKIKFLINLDLVGTGDDGIQIVNGSVHKSEFNLLQKINEESNYLKQIKTRGEAANSDHYPFHAKGVKSFFIYTLGGISEYHNIYDKAETLPLTEYSDIVAMLLKFVTSYE
jgi:Iap family predicted aminopeptidase